MNFGITETEVEEIASSPDLEEQRSERSILASGYETDSSSNSETTPLRFTGSTQEDQNSAEKPQKASMSSDRKVKLATFCLTYGIVVSLALLAVGLTEGQNIYDLIKGNKKGEEIK